MYNLKDVKTWRELEQLAERHKNDRIIDYFNQQPDRFDRMSTQAPGLFLDYSKNKITTGILSGLLDLANNANLKVKIERMFTGEKINQTEGRAVLHTALRNRSNKPVIVDGQNIMPLINESLQHIERFSEQIRSGSWLGYTGKPIKNIVNIGIGGSDLGPSMVCDALYDYQHPNLQFIFVSSVDSAQIKKALRYLDHQETLFIVSSKSFTTLETQLNSESAKQWFLDACKSSDQDISKHFVAVTANVDAAEKFGVARQNVFQLWEWVGGRFSLWSSIGLPIALCIGYQKFVEMLEGAHELDRHFQTVPFADNLPVLLALIGIWHINFQAADSQAVFPYDQPLHILPAFLQQLDMESNGKSVDINGEKIDYATAPIVWGQTGSNGQHAFFQLMHQGTRFVPVDFIGSQTKDSQNSKHSRALHTNMLAQAEAFMLGSDNSIDSSHQYCAGNNPSNTILLDSLNPKNLGALIALYEHKIFVQGVIWNINSFDQWGVQLGKKLAVNMVEQSPEDHDSSTAGLLKKLNLG